MEPPSLKKTKKPSSCRDDEAEETSTASARPQDVEWLSSLSEPELDFLISLKELADKRAMNAGKRCLGSKFDLRMLRALGAIVLEYTKETLRNKSMVPNRDQIVALLSGCNLALPSRENIVPSTHEEDIKTLTFATPKTENWKDFVESGHLNPRGKRKIEDDVLY